MGASSNAYAVYTLRAAFVTEVADGGDLIGGVVAEQLTLAVGSIGMQAGMARVCWDQVMNAACPPAAAAGSP